MALISFIWALLSWFGQCLVGLDSAWLVGVCYHALFGWFEIVILVSGLDRASLGYFISLNRSYKAGFRLLQAWLPELHLHAFWYAVFLSVNLCTSVLVCLI